MGAGPVSKPVGAPPSWTLAPAIAAETQGLVVSGFAALPFGRALFLSIAAGAAGGGWLRRLAEVAPVTSAAGAPPARAAAMAFTGTGLRRIGLGDPVLASFSRPFREGMFQEDRLRRLGDRRSGAWLETVVNPDGPEPRGPLWSANAAPDDVPANVPGRAAAFEVPHDRGPADDVPTPMTVHALLLLYAAAEGDAETWSDEVKALLPTLGVDVVRELDLLLDVEKQGISREHFGFADGLSQPAPFGLAEPIDETACVLVEGRPAPRRPVQGVPLGEVLIGYQNGHSEPAPGPVVPGDDAAAAGLPPHRLGEGFADLGVNGSYLVVRELRQDVAAFWQSLREQAAAMRAADPGAAHVDEVWLAERIIGRGTDGHLLCPGPTGYLKPDTFGA